MNGTKGKIRKRGLLSEAAKVAVLHPSRGRGKESPSILVGKVRNHSTS